MSAGAVDCHNCGAAVDLSGEPAIVLAVIKHFGGSAACDCCCGIASRHNAAIRVDDYLCAVDLL